MSQPGNRKRISSNYKKTAAAAAQIEIRLKPGVYVNPTYKMLQFGKR